MSKRKKTAAAETVKVANEESSGTPSTAVAESSERGESEAKAVRFRSWVNDREAGYERMTDEQARLLVIRFAQKPAADVLEQLKDAGFRYQAAYFGQQKVWTRKNDFEGRLRLQDIETQVRGIGAEQVPF